MIRTEQLLDSIVEAIRNKRRHGPQFPTPFDLGSVFMVVEEHEVEEDEPSMCYRIELDLFDPATSTVRKFDMYLEEVKEHGESCLVSDLDEELHDELSRALTISLEAQKGG